MMWLYAIRITLWFGFIWAIFPLGIMRFLIAWGCANLAMVATAVINRIEERQRIG